MEMSIYIYRFFGIWIALEILIFPLDEKGYLPFNLSLLDGRKDLRDISPDKFFKDFCDLPGEDDPAVAQRLQDKLEIIADFPAGQVENQGSRLFLERQEHFFLARLLGRRKSEE